MVAVVISDKRSCVSEPDGHNSQRAHAWSHGASSGIQQGAPLVGQNNSTASTITAMTSSANAMRTPSVMAAGWRTAAGAAAATSSGSGGAG
jgi:hypothetical protein